MKKFIRDKGYHLFKRFNSGIFSSNILTGNECSSLDMFDECIEPMPIQTRPGEVMADWGGVKPTFISKMPGPFYSEHRFNFHEGMPTNLHVYQNVIYHPVYQCLYSSDGKRIDHSTYWTRLQQTPPKIDVPKVVQKLDDEFVYIGDYTANLHYGHFLIEAIAPLYYLLLDPKVQVLCNEVRRPFKQTFVDEFFTLANFANRFWSLKSIVQIKKVIVPHHSLTFGYEAYTAHKLVPESVAQNIVSKSKHKEQPIYLSRTRLKSARKINQEVLLERILQKAGVLIVYPETLNLKQQILLINQHKTIIACSGSALHTVLFNINDKKRLIVIEDEDKYDKNFFIVDAIKSIDSFYISALRQTVPSTLGANRAVNRSLDLEFTVKAFKDLGVI